MTSLAVEPLAARIARAYFDALETGDFALVPWSQDVVLKTPLRPDAIEGRSSVEAFFRPLAGNLGPIHLDALYTTAAPDVFVAEARVGPLHVFDKFLLHDGRIAVQENVFDPRPALERPSAPGELSAQERELLLERLASSRDAARSACESWSDSSWFSRPRGAGWSPAECVEHLILAEEALLRILRGDILQSGANASLPGLLRGNDGVVVASILDRSTRVQTLPFLEPSGRWKTRQECRDAFLARRADTIEYVRATRDLLHHHGAPLASLGMLDGYQWLLAIAVHTTRHLYQIESLRPPGPAISN